MKLTFLNIKHTEFLNKISLETTVTLVWFGFMVYLDREGPKPGHGERTFVWLL